MTRWTGIVVATSDAAADTMVSRLPSYLHPILGRPLIWHTVAAMARLDPAPDLVFVIGGAEVSPDLFADITSPEIAVLRHEQLGDLDGASLGDGSSAVVVVDARADLPPASVRALLDSPSGSWLGDGVSVSAALLDQRLAPEVLRLPTPLQATRGVLTAAGRLPGVDPGLLVRDRVGLSEVAERVRSAIVVSHMTAGVTFLLPATTMVDVDVRIGKDTVIYPGVVLEGETRIGAEAVIGPGCRVIDSWIGDGVELKGWNYVARTSLRNRAILEPYVRRGFD